MAYFDWTPAPYVSDDADELARIIGPRASRPQGRDPRVTAAAEQAIIAQRQAEAATAGDPARRGAAAQKIARTAGTQLIPGIAGAISREEQGRLFREAGAAQQLEAAGARVGVQERGLRTDVQLLKDREETRHQMALSNAVATVLPQVAGMFASYQKSQEAEKAERTEEKSFLGELESDLYEPAPLTPTKAPEAPVEGALDYATTGGVAVSEKIADLFNYRKDMLANPNDPTKTELYNAFLNALSDTEKETALLALQKEEAFEAAQKIRIQEAFQRRDYSDDPVSGYWNEVGGM